MGTRPWGRPLESDATPMRSWIGTRALLGLTEPPPIHPSPPQTTHPTPTTTTTRLNQVCVSFSVSCLLVEPMRATMDVERDEGGGTGSARRRRERRLRMHWRHEQLSPRMALVTASHHSFDRVHAEYAAPRSQRTGTRAGEGEVRPQGLPDRHTGVGFELVLDPVVPQMAEQLVEVVATAPSVFHACGAVLQAPTPVVEDFAPAPAVFQASPVVENIAPVPAVFQASPVVEFFAPAPAVFHSPTPVVEYIAPTPVVHPSYPAPCRQDTTSSWSTDYGGNIYS